MMAVALVTTVSTAVSCPEPEPEQPAPPVVETKSAERKSFEAASEEGLYMKGAGSFVYDAETCQKAVNSQRRTYRIQSDDQRRFCHILFSDMTPSKVGDECVCTVEYRVEDGEETTLIVKFGVIEASDGRLWLWNEFQKVGVIIRQF